MASQLLLSSMTCKQRTQQPLFMFSNTFNWILKDVRINTRDGGNNRRDNGDDDDENDDDDTTSKKSFQYTIIRKQ